MKKLLAVTALTVMVLSSLCGHSLMNAQAGEAAPALQRYYTSIRIQPGDTMWQIAEAYAPSCGMTTEEYVEELKSMNGINEEIIHRGRYLTVLYCLPAAEEPDAEDPDAASEKEAPVQYLSMAIPER